MIIVRSADVPVLYCRVMALLKAHCDKKIARGSGLLHLNRKLYPSLVTYCK